MDCWSNIIYVYEKNNDFIDILKFEKLCCGRDNVQI